MIHENLGVEYHTVDIFNDGFTTTKDLTGYATVRCDCGLNETGKTEEIDEIAMEHYATFKKV